MRAARMVKIAVQNRLFVESDQSKSWFRFASNSHFKSVGIMPEELRLKEIHAVLFEVATGLILIELKFYFGIIMAPFRRSRMILVSC